ncbi:MAG: hypothetical protein E5Y73_25165 [Mesorhizobium sp.]|uniref:hypothetical protein n=1 Tax=Mesorhizobium sp. TaxID=1871066 RepID=UPI0011FDB5CF|nr:hypothetical protein [Mesorhizobium sp.]TIL87503.1 MAG: hypothetical protein E5Y73_25165 [Mesorhizobium sp.]
MKLLRTIEPAVLKFLIGQLLPPGSGRSASLMRALPSGSSLAVRMLRETVISLDDAKHGLSLVRFGPLRMLMYVSLAPALLMNEAVIWLIGGRPVRSIVGHPASKVLGLLRFLAPKKAYDRIFAQAIEDFREEYYEELAMGRIWRARWLHCCLYLILISTSFLWLGTTAAKKMVDLWKVS